MTWFYMLLRFITFVAFSFWFKIGYKGVENVPQHGGYIIASNHVSILDPILLSFKVPTMIHFLAKAELFSNPIFSAIFRGVGAVPIERGKGDVDTLSKFAKLLTPKKNIGIFPEGTRYLEGIGRPKSGLAMVTKMTKSDVLPCSIVIERPMRFKSKIDITYGELIPYEKLGLEDDTMKALKVATKTVWGEIRVMAGYPLEEPKRIIAKSSAQSDATEPVESCEIHDKQ